MYAAVYLDPARLFPLALTGEPKKPVGMGDKQFFRMVFGSWDEVDFSQINWTDPAPFVAGIRNPYDPKLMNPKKDAAQNEIQYGRRDGKSIPFLAFLYRYAEERKTDAQVEKVMAKFRTISAELSRSSTGMERRCRVLLSTKHAPEPLPYARLPEELRAHPWPNVMEYPPEGMADAGVAMLRKVNRSPGFRVEAALMLTTVKNVIHVKLGSRRKQKFERFRTPRW